MPHVNERRVDGGETDARWAEIRSLLDRRERELLVDVRGTLQNTDEQKYLEIIGRIPADTGDASVSDLIADLNLALLDRHVHELRDIEAARERMRDGTYGTCIDCGRPIDPARLLVQPTALRCVQHQEQFEKTHAGAPPSL